MLSPLPYKRIEYTAGSEADALVQRDGSRVCLGDSERNRAEVSVAQFSGGRCQQGFAQAAGAIFWQNAYLSDMSDIWTHLRAKNQSDQIACGLLKYQARSLRIEDPASRKTHDVI